MKKNKWMRLASLLLVLCLMTTCAVSGTYAKYVTSGNASDSARVAKFGVVLTIDGDASFSNEYATEDTAKYSGTVSVKSYDDAKVVAPGTSSEDVTNGKLSFSISGKPEVATKIDITFTPEKDIFVKGTIPNYTVAGNVAAGGEQVYPEETLSADYYPVVFTLVQTADASGALATPVQIAKGNLAAIQTALNAYTGATYAPNTDLAATFELSWAWSYGTYNLPNKEYTSKQGLDPADDIADTFLGNVAADNSFASYKVYSNETVESKTVAAGNYSTELAYTLTIAVTQVD